MYHRPYFKQILTEVVLITEVVLFLNVRFKRLYAFAALGNTSKHLTHVCQPILSML